MNCSEMSTELLPFSLLERGTDISDNILDPCALLDSISDVFIPRCQQSPEANNVGDSSSSNLDCSPSSQNDFISPYSGIDEGDDYSLCTYFDLTTPQSDEINRLREEENLRAIDPIDDEFLLDSDHHGDAISPSHSLGQYLHGYQPSYQTSDSCQTYRNTSMDHYEQNRYYDRCPYSTVPSYEQSKQATWMSQNLPNLPPLTTPCRFNSLDSDPDSDDEEPPRKGKRGSKSVLLWKFLLEKLEDPNFTPNILCWEDKPRGVFKFVDTSAVAKHWGEQKRKQDMNFEKLSRGIRHYYKPGMMNRVEGKRLVYKFNWKKVPREYRRRI